MKKKNIILTCLSVLILFVFLLYSNKNFDSYKIRILNLCAIYAVLGLSMNLINGFTGLFSLGHAGFMAVGAYTTALLTMTPESKEATFFLEPIIPSLANIELPFFAALIIAGFLSAGIAFLIGAPTLRLKGDYLAIATLGCSEIIRIVFTQTQNITNGPTGLKSIPNTTNLWWSFGTMIFTIIVMVSLINSSYGKAFKAIREDEIAAESMGINLFKHKVMSFAIGAFFAGVGGGLLGNLLGTINPNMFKFTLTFNVLLIIVLGGMGSITGTIISSFIVTAGLEYLRFLDESINLGFIKLEGVAGMRMVVFSTLLMIVVIFFRNGLMGNKEFSWDKFFNFFNRRPFSKKGVQG